MVIRFARIMTNNILVVFDHRLPLAAGCSSTSTPVEPPEEKVEAPSVSIHQGAYKGDIETILQHHAAGTDIDLRNQWNATPLHYSARSGKLIGAQALVGVGADVNAKNDDGDTPFTLPHQKAAPRSSHRF